MQRLAFLLFAVGAVGCGEKDIDSGWDADADADTDADTDTDSDADTDVSYFDAVAVGFEYFGGLDLENEELLPFDYDDTQGQRTQFVLITFADTDFVAAETAEEQDAHSCEAYAYFDYAVEDLECRSFDDDSVGDTHVEFTGVLLFGEEQLNGDNCFAFDPADGWTDGMPVARFNGMKFGMGFGPMTEYLATRYTDEESQALARSSAYAAYIGMNHPGGVGDVEFVGYDWTIAWAFDWDVETGIVATEEGTTLVRVETENISNAYVQSSAYWYEDFPNLDLDGLVE